MSIIRELQSCSIGILKDKISQCHKLTSLVKSKSLISFALIKEEDKEKLIYRTGLCDQKDKILTVCLHHKTMLIDTYEFHQKHCCNPFNSHKKNISQHLQVITVKFAKELLEKQFVIVPGKKVCGNCKTKLNKVCETVSSSDADLTGSTDSEEDICAANLSNSELNTSLSEIGQSPIKLHGIPSSSRLHYGKRKLLSINNEISKRVATALKVPLQEVSSEKQLEECELKQKARDLDILMKKIKEKLDKQETTRSEKIQLLTLVPDSWSRNFVIEFFQVSDYMVRAARSLAATQGIVSKPPVRKGKTLNVEIKKTIHDFYCDNENTRIMPGARDKVSIATNVYEQKRLILCTLKELYQSFKETYPEIKVGFSTFATIRPKWCVLAGSAGTHAVCVCTIHQNVILMLKPAQIEESYQDLISMMVCDIKNKDCMLQRCTNCPRDGIVADYLESKFNDINDNITFSQWITTDRTEMICQMLPVNEYLKLLMAKLIKLLPHSFIAKQQSNFFKHRKQSLEDGTVLCLTDFSENYAFHIPDEAQGYHWTHSNCTVHPVVCYYSTNGNLQHFSLCFLSKDLNHDIAMVYEIQKEIIRFLKDKLGAINKVEYFTDGCASQYKNCKNFVNLCMHENDFGICAEWSFFATSHGKSACDGIGGTVKRSTTLESLRRPLKNQILNLEEMLKHCKQAITSIYFKEIQQQALETTRVWLQQRFVYAKTIKGTRSFHNFKPMSTTRIFTKRINFDENYSYMFDFLQPIYCEQPAVTSVKQGSYVAATYDKYWYIGFVAQADIDNGDVKVNFLHPKGPATSFHFPKYEDLCWIPTDHILCCIEPPTLATTRGQYQITPETAKKISIAFLKKSS